MNPDNPSKQEWTADMVQRLEFDNPDRRYEAIAYAHNAALAAALTQLHDEWWQRVQDANKQLAAEREDRISWQELYEKTNDQLAAERERYERLLDLAGAQNMGIDNLSKLDDLQQQLAAEREKLANRHKLCVHYETIYKECRDKLAAEREITFAAQQAALKEGIRSGELEQQLAAERKKESSGG